jgi:hypothetical protein
LLLLERIENTNHEHIDRFAEDEIEEIESGARRNYEEIANE